MNFEWLDLSEREFLAFMKNKVKETGNIGDVVPQMIMYNVPMFVLSNIWPEKAAEIRAKPALTSFVIAEDGWKGKLQNVKSELRSTDEGSGFELEFAKSYVIDSELLLVMARYGEDYALCPVPRDENQSWKPRDIDEVRLKTTEDVVYDHNRVSGVRSFTEGEFVGIKLRGYARLGMQIPVREISSFAMLTRGLAAFHGLADTPAVQEQEEALIQAREKGRLNKNLIKLSIELLEDFDLKMNAAKIERHPFFKKIEGFKQILGARV